MFADLSSIVNDFHGKVCDEVRGGLDALGFDSVAQPAAPRAPERSPQEIRFASHSLRANLGNYGQAGKAMVAAACQAAEGIVAFPAAPQELRSITGLLREQMDCAAARQQAGLKQLFSKVDLDSISGSSQPNVLYEFTGLSAELGQLECQQTRELFVSILQMQQEYLIALGTALGQAAEVASVSSCGGCGADPSAPQRSVEKPPTIDLLDDACSVATKAPLEQEDRASSCLTPSSSCANFLPSRERVGSPPLPFGTDVSERAGSSVADLDACSMCSESVASNCMRPETGAEAAEQPVPDLLDFNFDDVGAEAVERRQEEERRAQEQAQRAEEGRQQLETAQRAEEERNRVEVQQPEERRQEEEDDQSAEARVQDWADGKNILALLASLHEVAPGDVWKERTLGDLLDAKRLRDAYRAALLAFHPDKLPEHKTLGQTVVNALVPAMAAHKRS